MMFLLTALAVLATIALVVGVLLTPNGFGY